MAIKKHFHRLMIFVFKVVIKIQFGHLSTLLAREGKIKQQMIFPYLRLSNHFQPKGKAAGPK